MLGVSECVQLACVLEATARKPGNVHRFCDFEDVTYLDFLLSSAAIAPVFEHAATRGVGPTILSAIQATRRVVATNTNLGIVLLLAPLAAVPRESGLRDGILAVLDRLTIDDSRAVFEAIRLANPSGLGQAAEQDVRSVPTRPLREIMALATERDTIARQYANGFRDVIDVGVPALVAKRSARLEAAIIDCHVRLLAELPDSHIARRCGPATAAEASRRAAAVVAGGDVTDLDSWLRADGHRRNPGSTADLVAASLFVALREGTIQLPLTF